jgi:hypothetical protein
MMPDGTRIEINREQHLSQIDALIQNRNHGSITFPTWIFKKQDEQQVHAFHSTSRLSGNRDGLLIDCGAIDNLTGDAWIRRVEAAARAHGRGSEWKPLAEERSCQGVGTGSQSATQTAKVPLMMPGGLEGTFETMVLNESDLPALLGYKSLNKMRALIDTDSNKLILVGPGGYELKLSPGSKVFQLEQSASGHLLLPVTEWMAAMKHGVKHEKPLHLYGTEKVSAGPAVSFQ